MELKTKKLNDRYVEKISKMRVVWTKERFGAKKEIVKKTNL